MGADLILYSRGYCHLCDDMQQALAPLQAEFEFRLTVVDVDADPELVALYDELVPVLVAPQADGSMRRLCHYFLDQAAVRGYFHESRT